mgnify:CR=1 FL=1
MKEKIITQTHPSDKISQELALLREEVTQIKTLLLANLKYLNQDQACLFLGVSRATFIKFIQPELKPVRIGKPLAYKKQKYLFAMTDIENFLQDRHRNSDHWKRGAETMKKVKEETEWEKSLSQEEWEVWNAEKGPSHERGDFPLTLEQQKERLKELMNTEGRKREPGHRPVWTRSTPNGIIVTNNEWSGEPPEADKGDEQP